MLADGGFSGLRPQEKPAGPIEIPDRSVLVVRASGAALGALTLEVAGQRWRGAAPRGAGAGQRHRRGRAQARGAQVGHRVGLRRRHAAAELAVRGDARPPAQDLPDQGARAHPARRAQALLQGRGRLRRRLRRGPHPPRARPRRTSPRPPGPGPAPRRARGRPTSGRRRWRCGCRAPTPSRPRARASTRSATIPGPA